MITAIDSSVVSSSRSRRALLLRLGCARSSLEPHRGDPGETRFVRQPDPNTRVGRHFERATPQGTLNATDEPRRLPSFSSRPWDARRNYEEVARLGGDNL